MTMFKRKFITPCENAANVVYLPEVCLYHAILREQSPVDSFYQEKCKPCHDDMESVSFVDPILILFNQDRLDNLGTMAAKQFLDSLQQKESSLAILRKNVSDEDLCAMLKSRYLQTPSEVTTWCRYISANVDKFNSEVQAFLDAKKQEQTIETTVTNPQTE